MPYDKKKRPAKKAASSKDSKDGKSMPPWMDKAKAGAKKKATARKAKKK